jgi:hypothetical protein
MNELITFSINITTVKNDKNQFRVALRSYLLNHSFYSIDEFIEAKNSNE